MPRKPSAKGGKIALDFCKGELHFCGSRLHRTLWADTAVDSGWQEVTLEAKRLPDKPLEAIALDCISIFFCDCYTKTSHWQPCSLPTNDEYLPLKDRSMLGQSE